MEEDITSYFPRNIEEMKCFLENGVDVNYAVEFGMTLVHRACNLNYFEMVKYLVVKHNADIFIPCNQGITCLLSSIHSRSICRLLIDYGMDVNAQEPIFGYSALHFAIENKRLDTV